MDLSAQEIRRFWANVTKGDGCWPYSNGSQNRYAHFYARAEPEGKKRALPAHRVSYFLHHGQLPKKADIDHLCFNRGCVRPEHLEAVSRATNVARARMHHGIGRFGATCLHGHDTAKYRTYIKKGNGRITSRCELCHRRVKKDLWDRRLLQKHGAHFYDHKTAYALFCKHGHRRTRDTVRFSKQGNMFCRVCHLAKGRRQYAQRKCASN